MRQRLVLACQRCGRYLSDHKARVDPAVTHQERWQLGHVFIHHQRDTALGQRADFGNRQRDIIRRHRHRLGVEVAPGDHLVFLGEHQRVIGHRVGLHQQDLRRLTQLRQARAHHLRLAAQGIGILNLLAVMV